MAIFIGIFVVALVLFMVFAMALAEWADLDPGQLWARLFRSRSLSSPMPESVPAAMCSPSAMPATPGRAAAPGRKPVSSRKTGSRRSSQTTTSQGNKK